LENNNHLLLKNQNKPSTDPVQRRPGEKAKLAGMVEGGQYGAESSAAFYLNPKLQWINMTNIAV
jgi:hypothetical protein